MCENIKLKFSIGVFLNDLQDKIRDAFENKDLENKSVILIQKIYRGTLAREFFRRNVYFFIEIQRVFRGHKGRDKVKNAKKSKQVSRQVALFQYFSVQIQKIFRAFYSRKYKNNFYKRKTYLLTVAAKGTEMRQQMLQYAKEQENYEEMESTNKKESEFKKFASNLHHLLSTKQIRGIYNPNPNHMETPTMNNIAIEDHVRGFVKDLLRTRTLSSKARSLLQPDLRGSHKIPLKGLQNHLSIQATSPYDICKQATKKQVELHRIITRGKGNFLAGGKTSLINNTALPLCTDDPFSDSYANPIAIRGVPKDQKQLNESTYSRKPLFVTSQERPFYLRADGNKSTVHPNDIFDIIAVADETGGAVQRQLGTSTRFGVPDNADHRPKDNGAPLKLLRVSAKVPTRARVKTVKFNVTSRSQETPIKKTYMDNEDSSSDDDMYLETSDTKGET